MIAILLAAAAVSYAAPKPAHPLQVELKDGAGKKVGTAKLTELKTGVSVHLEVEGLTPGEHAVHFHEKGSCVGPDFKSAGGHYNPSKKEHGLDNPKGPHEGDMRNFTVGEDGKASVDVKDERVNLGKGAYTLLQKGGTALVIHAKADDNKSQPAGAAGDRVACGVIPGRK
jgi:Cu-Zn family superoxide dismutase